MARTLTDGEREVLAEQNADAYEVHAGCDVEPCADCLDIEEMDAAAYEAIIADYQAEFARDSRHDPIDIEIEYPF